ncbi:MAG: hypothetical protein ACLU4N_07455 [Butyricimonas faecihominis]
MEIGFFVENSNLTFQTPHIDSLPQSFWLYDIRKGKNYTLKGSVAQDIFYQYQQQTISSRHEIESSPKPTWKTGMLKTSKPRTRKQIKLENQTKEFMRSHQNLAVNLYLRGTIEKKSLSLAIRRTWMN